MYTTPFHSPEQIFHYAQVDKKPVFVTYFINGNNRGIFFREAFLDMAKKYHKFDFDFIRQIHFIPINCSHHIDVCLNEDIKYFPKIQLVTDKKIFKFEKDYTQFGIEAFFVVY